jgi:hypothetical protein
VNRTKKGRPSAGGVEAELVRFAELDVDQLRREWKRRFNADSPPVRSRNLLYRLLAWQIQADAFGSLDRKIERLLDGIAERLERDRGCEPKIRRGLSPGIELGPGSTKFLAKRSTG